MRYKIAIATMTLDRKGNAELMESALDVLSKLPYPVYVSDGGSSERFVQSLNKMGHNVKYVPGGLTYQHRDAISRASNSGQIVLYTEPDKYDWFCNGLEETVKLYEADKQEFAAVGRTPDIFRTFPTHQQKWEKRMNGIITEKVGVKGDFIYGPKLFPQSLGHMVEEIDEDIGWGTLMFLVGRASKIGLPIRNIYTANQCPFDQRNDDNGNYRKKQFKDNKKGFNLGLR